MAKRDKGQLIAIQGDCIEVMNSITNRFDLVFADPPFNIGVQYDAYHDNMDEEEFRNWNSDWIVAASKKTSQDGVLALHGPDDMLIHYLSIVHELGWKKLGHVVWHYNFGQCRWTNWVSSKCHVVFCQPHVKHYEKATNIWNPEDVAIESVRAKTGDKRIHDTERGGRRPPGDVWGIQSMDGPYWGRVQGNSTERQSEFPNQLPEVYLERVIKAYTNPGCWVLDPFCGSGTTATVATTLSRHCTTIDLSEKAIENVYKRVEKGAVRIKPLQK